MKKKSLIFCIISFFAVVFLFPNLSFASDADTKDKERWARVNAMLEPNRTITVHKYARFIVKDASGSFYQAVDLGGAKNGIGDTYFVLENIENGERVVLLSGLYDAEQGGCGRPALGIKTAIDDQDFQIKKLDSDYWLDIAVEHTETDCVTGQKKHIKNTFIATKNGFVAQTEN